MPIPSGPYNSAAAIVKSDTVGYDRQPADAIYVGGAGIVVAVFPDGTTANFTAVAGDLIPIRTIRVNSGTTTATLMVALYQI